MSVKCQHEGCVELAVAGLTIVSPNARVEDPIHEQSAIPYCEEHLEEHRRERTVEQVVFVFQYDDEDADVQEALDRR